MRRWPHERGRVSSAYGSLRAGVSPCCTTSTKLTDDAERFSESCDGTITENCSMPGQFRPRGVTMRDCLKNRAGFDRVLMAVAATFLTVSATSAMAQSRSGPQQRRRTRDRCGGPASRTRQRPASDHQRLQDGRQARSRSPQSRRRQGRSTEGRRRRKLSHAESTPPKPRRRQDDRAKKDDATSTRPHPRHRTHPPPSPPRSRSRLRATSRPPTSRSPTS